MITSLKKLLENKKIVSYEQYNLVKKELLGRMFPDLRFKLTGNTVKNGAKTYSEMEAYSEDLKVLRNEFPEYFEWSDIRFNLEFLDFSSIIKFVEALPSEGYLTESYDRDRFAEYCRIPLDKYELFKKDL